MFVLLYSSFSHYLEEIYLNQISGSYAGRRASRRVAGGIGVVASFSHEDNMIIYIYIYIYIYICIYVCILLDSWVCGRAGWQEYCVSDVGGGEMRLIYFHDLLFACSVWLDISVVHFHIHFCSIGLSITRSSCCVLEKENRLYLNDASKGTYPCSSVRINKTK
jgi:hypothetical protein